MLIQIRQARKRPASGGGFRYGTDVVLGKGPQQRSYRFRPLDPKRPEIEHVCDIDNEEDIARLLAIPEGFKIHTSQVAKNKRPASAGTSGAEAAASGTAAAGNGTQDYSKLSRDELLAAVAEKTGKKPSPVTAKKKLLELLAA